MSRKYAPRAASRTRWLEGAPAEVMDCFDSKGPGDRYTVFLYKDHAFHVTRDGAIHTGPGEFGNTWFPYFGASAHPTHPQGVGMWGEMEAYQAVRYRYRHKHRRIKWLDLPEEVRACVLRGLQSQEPAKV